MMTATETIIIPPHLIRRIEAFLAEAKTGSITWHVRDGKILKCDLIDSYRVTDDDGPLIRDPRTLT